MSHNGSLDTRTQVIKIERDRPEEKRIPLVCAWCNKVYGLAKWEVKLGQETKISHGICPECFESFKEKNPSFEFPKKPDAK